MSDKMSTLDMFNRASDLKRAAAEADKDAKPYPGNTPPRNSPAGTHGKRAASAKKELPSKLYKAADGTEQRFYPIKAVCMIFGREPVTIRSWEAKGVLPKPKFRSPKPVGVKSGPNTKGRRLYTQNQIEYLMLLNEQYHMSDKSRADWDGFVKAMKDYPSE